VEEEGKEASSKEGGVIERGGFRLDRSEGVAGS